MADITLAEFGGAVWLVGGEVHIDDFLANTLPPHVTIELIPCETKSQVHALWEQNCGPPTFQGDPWLIHPAIVNRVRRNQAGYAVYFAQWSAQLDDQAMSVIHAAARAVHGGSARLVLTEYVDDTAPAFAADLAKVRLGLIEQVLLSEGLPPGRLGRAQRDMAEAAAMGQDAQRVDLVIVEEG
ncbi:MAG: hypothetical protein WDN04_03990 [Rhodospirillales bacterium]